MKLSKRQEKIIEIVKEKEPITSEEIASRLSVTRSTLRSDLAILTMSGILDARPKIGYFYSGSDQTLLAAERIKNRTVGELMSVPVLIDERMSISDGIVQLFIADVGTIFVINSEKKLVGIISRKDFLKFAISERNLQDLPLAMIMTRSPNLVTLSEGASLVEAAQLLVNHEIDALPVLRGEEVVGRFTKTNLTKFFLEIAGE